MFNSRGYRYIYGLMFLIFLASSVASLAEVIIIDNGGTGYSSSGSWIAGTSASDKYGSNYYWTNVTIGSSNATTTWKPTLSYSSIYRVSVWYPQGTNRSSDAQFNIYYKNGSESVKINQIMHGGQWVVLGTYPFNSGTDGYVELVNHTNSTAGPLVLADAVKFENYTFPISKTGGELRGFWIEAPYLGAGFASDVQAQASIVTARRYNFNVVFPEIRQFGDAYYKSTYEPIKQTYDGLSGLIYYAHNTASGNPYVEIHAWMVTNRISISASPGATHVMTLHPEWLSLTNTGANNDGSYYLDFGVPDASEYNEKIIMDVVRNYDVDGINMDYIRFNGNTWGYNTIAIARYNAEYGVSGSPTYTDDRWEQWRRDNVSDFVKRIYVNAITVKPNIKISAATAHNGTTGPSCLSDATSSRLQEWPKWLRGHYLDISYPMIYKDTYSWYTNIVAYDYATVNATGRHMYPILGNYMNTTSDSADQMRYTKAHALYKGQAIYCYTDTNTDSVSNTNFYNMVSTQFFSTVTHVPSMSWKSSPSTGIIRGYVTSTSLTPYPFFDGEKVYKSRIVYSGTGGSGTTYTDLVGFYAFLDVPQGTYTVKAYRPISSGTYNNSSCAAIFGVDVQRGMVANGNLNADILYQGTVPVELSCFETDIDIPISRSLYVND